jgi:pimeloyl-ACP methyl ester carboxylesterase
MTIPSSDDVGGSGRTGRVSALGNDAGPDLCPHPVRTVIALPGSFCDPAIFGPVSARLAGRFELRALSWMTEALEWSVDALAKWVADDIRSDWQGPVLLVGHSTGGAIALQVATTQPHLLRGLMLINTGPNVHNRGDVRDLIARMERVIDRSFHHAPPPDEYRRLLDYGRAVPARVALDVLRSQDALDFVPVLPTLRLPVSVVHGRFDRVRTLDQARAMADALPNGRLCVVDAGHSPMYEVPDAVAAALDDLDQRSEGDRSIESRGDCETFGVTPDHGSDTDDRDDVPCGEHRGPQARNRPGRAG